MQSFRSLPVPCASISRIGITVSMAQTQASVTPAAVLLDADRADLQLEAVVFENDAVIIHHANDANNGKAARNRVKSILCGRSERN